MVTWEAHIQQMVPLFSDVLVIKVKERLKHKKKPNQYNQFVIIACFHCLSRSTMAASKHVNIV